MQNVKLKNYLHLHFLVFIAGFTAILGELISIKAVPLVWYRMLIASVLIFIYIKLRKINIRVPREVLVKLIGVGIIIALHWITFFWSIEVSNISITLAMFSSGAFFASFLEPIIYKRRIIWYEIVFGLLVILGVYIITQSEMRYLGGIILGLSSALFSSLFAVLNGKLIERHSATVISFYEFISGVLFISVFMLFYKEGFTSKALSLTTLDSIYLFILGSVCTAYAFIAAVYVMKHISPYSVVLTYNLEPIYGIILAILVFPKKEIMSSNFYYGTAIIIGVVLLNGILKNSNSLKREHS